MSPAAEAPAGARERAGASLRALLEDPALPPKVRASLRPELEQVQAMLDKLEHGHVHIAVFGRVGVGKSALLNALLGEARFATSPLHGETRRADTAAWTEVESGGVYLIDTPGINEVHGEDRERLAHEVAQRSDLVLFVAEGDLSDSELAALRLLARQGRPLLLVLNKADRYVADDRDLLLTSLRGRSAGLVAPENVVAAAAAPAERLVVTVDAEGRETESRRRPRPDVDALRERLWAILEREGEALAALNAGLFAGRLSDELARRVVAVKRDLAERVVRNYCLAKGIAVGLNPVPVTDLVAAVAVDVGMVMHLSRVYGLPVTRHEAGRLVRTIGAQMSLLMGTVWAVHFASSALKTGSLGLSTAFTAAAQGAVAYYTTFVVGRAAHRYFERGKSWGPQGPKRAVQDILDTVDRDSLLAQAREDILGRLRAG